MGTIQLAERLYSVGVLNPGLRIFDIIMPAPYGTSYNAYLLTGEKNVLVETVHADYWDEYRSNIEQVLPLEKIDYLVMNHNEPDHSGSVAKLLEACPNLTILCTAAGKKHLTDITNSAALPCRVVKQGDSVDLGGGRTLEFLPSAMLHWADSMFTWCPQDKVLFTCDFLGAHYCEPTMLDRNIHDQKAYLDMVAHYYNCIFGPFKPHVLAGLDKIEPLNPAIICPSHGPCLTSCIGEIEGLYRQWSTPAAKDGKMAAVLYCSAYGCTAALAEAAAAALREAGVRVELRDVSTTPLSEAAALANECDLLAVGAPTINRDAPKPIWDVLTSIDAINCAKKPAFVFGSYGWSGEGPEMLRSRLSQLRFSVPDAAFRCTFTPAQADLDAVATLAREAVAKLG